MIATAKPKKHLPKRERRATEHLLTSFERRLDAIEAKRAAQTGCPFAEDRLARLRAMIAEADALIIRARRLADRRRQEAA